VDINPNSDQLDLFWKSAATCGFMLPTDRSVLVGAVLRQANPMALLMANSNSRGDPNGMLGSGVKYS